MNPALLVVFAAAMTVLTTRALAQMREGLPVATYDTTPDEFVREAVSRFSPSDVESVTFDQDSFGWNGGGHRDGVTITDRKLISEFYDGLADARGDYAFHQNASGYILVRLKRKVTIMQEQRSWFELGLDRGQHH